MSGNNKTKYSDAVLCLGGCGAPFTDGYLEISIGFILFSGASSLGLTAWEMGAFASFYLVGSLVGSFLFGSLTRKIGPNRLFLVLPLLSALASLSQLWIFSVPLLIGVRALLGVIAGAEYPVSQMIVSTQTTPDFRAKSLVWMMAGWYAGALWAVGISFAVLKLGFDWRVLAATSAAVSLSFFLIRIGAVRFIRKKRALSSDSPSIQGKSFGFTRQEVKSDIIQTFG